MTSLTQTAYGLRVARHGRSRLCSRYQSSNRRAMIEPWPARSSTDGGDVLLPVLAIELPDREGAREVAVEAPHVDVYFIRVRARRVERVDAADRAEAMFCRARIEFVDGKHLRAGEQLEILRVDDQV